MGCSQSKQNQVCQPLKTAHHQQQNIEKINQISTSSFLVKQSSLSSIKQTLQVDLFKKEIKAQTKKQKFIAKMISFPVQIPAIINIDSYYQSKIKHKIKVQGKQSMYYNQLLKQMGTKMQDFQGQKQLRDNFLKNLNIYQKGKGRYSKDCAQILQKIGSSLRLKNKTAQALDYFRRSQKIYQKTKQSNDQYVEMLVTIAEIAEQNKNYHQAYEYFSKSLCILDSNGKTETNQILSIQEKMGDMAFLNQEYEIAVQKYEKCLLFFKKQMKDQYPQFSSLLFKAAVSYYYSNNFSQSQNYFQIFSKRSTGLEKIIAQNNLAVVILKQQEYIQSFQLLRDCLNSRNNVDSKQHILQIINNLLLVLIKLEDSQQIKNLQGLIFKCLQQSFDHSSKDILYVIWHNIAFLFQSQQQYRQALQYYQKIPQQILQKHNQFLTNLNMGNIFYRLNQNEKSYKCYEKCLSCQRNHYGQENQKLQQFLKQIKVYLKENYSKGPNFN